MTSRLFTTAVSAIILSLLLSSASVCAPGKSSIASVNTPKQDEEPWWKHAVFYEIYPRSFADSRGTGTGDINGITSRLDYLKDLGVDAIWLTPCYPSPQIDFGYDISDYENIAPEYGTLADFDRLVSEAKKRKIRIVMDLVMNHTSDKHPWFVESRSSRSNPKRNWYIWRDGRAGGLPPNNWQAVFGHSAWQLDPKTGQYYYHYFYPQQPDLNWRNRDVRQAMYDVARFWLDRGVAGFRLDAVNALFEDPNLKDNPTMPGKNSYGDPKMDNKYNNQLPEGHDVLRELRQVLDAYPDNRVLVGETSGKDVASLCSMYGKHNDEIQLPMNFFFAYINKLSATEFRRQIDQWDRNPAGGWPVYLFSNHDQARHYNRYGDGRHNDQIAKLTAAMMLTLRGTPLLYYGEEIGMSNNDPKRVEDVLDPIGKIGWPKEKGRDGERTPMQWDSSANAGFSPAGKTWVPVSPDYKKKNVLSERQDPNSILNFYRRLISLRRSEPALIRGSYTALNENDRHVLSYLRKEGGSAVLVALNMSASPRAASFDLSRLGVKGKHAKTLISTSAAQAQNVSLSRVQLSPYAVYIGEISR